MTFRPQRIILHGFAVVGGLLVMCPLYWMLSTSLKPSSEIILGPTIGPHHPTIEHYTSLLQASNFLRYFANSLFVGVCVVALTSITAVLGAYGLARGAFRGRDALSFLFLASYMVAPIMIVIPIYIIMRSLGLGNTHLALILAQTSFCFPFALWLMKAYFEEIPKSLELAALLDGASRLRVFLEISLPLARPGIVAVSIFVFILSWNDYVFASILITSDDLKTLPVGLEDMYSATVVDWGLLMAAGVAVTVPVLAGFVAINRALMRGWGISGLKG